MQTWNQVEGHWTEMKGKVKQQWAKLTDDDLNAIGGKREQLEGAIERRYAMARDKVHTDIDSWLNRLN